MEIKITLGKSKLLKQICKKIIHKDRINKIKILLGIKIKCSICENIIQEKICPVCKHNIKDKPGIVDRKKILHQKPVIYSEEE